MADWSLSWRLEDVPDLADRITGLTKEANADVKAWTFHSSPVTTNFQLPGVRTNNMENVPEDQGIRFLQSLEVDTSEDCYIIWAGPDLGISVQTEIAFRHFYDLWYPGSDDIWILNHGRTWILDCNHHGRARFVRL